MKQRTRKISKTLLLAASASVLVLSTQAQAHRVADYWLPSYIFYSYQHHPGYGHHRPVQHKKYSRHDKKYRWKHKKHHGGHPKKYSHSHDHYSDRKIIKRKHHLAD